MAFGLSVRVGGNQARDQHNKMQTVQYLTKSITAAIRASAENYQAEVVLAKRSDGVRAIVRRDFPERRTAFFSIGYARFGMRTVWIEKKREIVAGSAYLLCSDGTPLDKALVEQWACSAFAAADEVTALRNASREAVATLDALNC